MKGLLQSKKFRKNLGKWLFMYAGVMLLLTTVITYSKYISSFNGSDNASTARFDLSVYCVNNSGDVCDTAILRKITEDTPDNELTFNYSFVVDTTKMDVKSNLKLLIFVDKSFIIEDISTGYNEIECENSDTTTCPENSTMYILDNIYLPTNFNLTFTMRVKYDKSKIEELADYTDENNPLSKEVVAIGYKVEQIGS